MKWALFFIFLIVPWIQAWIDTESADVQERAYQNLNDALESASQAAVLNVEPTSVSDGNIVFNQGQANATFYQMLAQDMDLDSSTLQPLPGSIYQSAPIVKVTQFFDYSNTNFPVHYLNSTYNIDTWIYGPSIVYVVQEAAPKPYTSSTPFTMTWPDVVSYPDK